MVDERLAMVNVSAEEIERFNLSSADLRGRRLPPGDIHHQRLEDLEAEKRIRTVIVLFTDLEGRLHSLDYDKQFLTRHCDNLTFDGSSVRGFSAQRESDLRLALDWSTLLWCPAEIFGSCKALVFADVMARDGTRYLADARGMLKTFAESAYRERAYTLEAACEVEGFLFQGTDAERRHRETGTFEYVNTGGYFYANPGDPLRTFLETVSLSLRALGFRNEKCHSEVAPSQFEVNYEFDEALAAADRIQIYKLVCRQVAARMGATASFLPKPIVGINGSGMHTNVSVSKDGSNLFWDPSGPDNLSSQAWSFVDRIFLHASEFCPILNSSVNAYRRLDPHFEAPNQIKASSVDRGAMVRIPLANERSARLEIRSVSPDANPYLMLYAVFRSGLEGAIFPIENLRQADLYLPDNICSAIELFDGSAWITKLLGDDVKSRYAGLKRAVADRCPRLLGRIIKNGEVQYHHEVYNQRLWELF